MRIHASFAGLVSRSIEPDTSLKTSRLAPDDADGASASAIAHGSASVNSTAEASTFMRTRVRDSGVPQRTPAVTAAQSATAIAQRAARASTAGEGRQQRRVRSNAFETILGDGGRFALQLLRSLRDFSRTSRSELCSEFIIHGRSGRATRTDRSCGRSLFCGFARTSTLRIAALPTGAERSRVSRHRVPSGRVLPLRKVLRRRAVEMSSPPDPVNRRRRSDPELDLLPRPRRSVHSHDAKRHEDALWRRVNPSEHADALH